MGIEIENSDSSHTESDEELPPSPSSAFSSPRHSRLASYIGSGETTPRDSDTDTDPEEKITDLMQALDEGPARPVQGQ